MPPMPEPMKTPTRRRGPGVEVEPARRCSAMSAAATANWTKRSICLASLRSMTPSNGSKSFTSHAKRVE